MCLPVCWFFSFSSFERETKNTLRCRIENIFSLWSLGSASPFTATSIVPVVTGPSAKDHGHSWTSRFKETLVTFTTLLDPYSLQLSRQEAQGRKKSAETFYCKTVTWAQLVAFHSSYFTTNSIWCGDAVFSLGRGGSGCFDVLSAQMNPGICCDAWRHSWVSKCNCALFCPGQSWVFPWDNGSCHTTRARI